MARIFGILIGNFLEEEIKLSSFQEHEELELSFVVAYVSGDKN
jgi:hypothetical protein